tara:strand:- start:1290 stop:2312 length:1023 start_codon:yes stop_codon:yes gene_type:complete
MPLYTLGFVYQLSDFDTTGSNIAPPDEQGARAQGSPPFDMTLNPGTVPLRLVIDDADSDFHETTGSDPLQELADPVTIDGVLYPAGSHVVLNYVLTDADGFEGFSITIGSPNSGNNTTTAFITNQVMEPGTTYTFISEGNIGAGGARPYAEFACFTAGTLIETPQGPRMIETLNAGDLVCTVNNGPQELVWVGQKIVQGRGPMAPVTIRAGAFGTTADLTISPNHRILVEGAAAEVVTGCSRVLVAAKHLIDGVRVVQNETNQITYVHLLFASHEIVVTQGCQSESFFLSATSAEILGRAQAREIRALFPHLMQRPAEALLALPEARPCEAAYIRHLSAA